MAVYTIIDKKLLYSFLNNYDLGELLDFEGIKEGVENSNYKITTSQGIYILTIFEKRVEEKELPFFVELKKHFVQKKFMCPKPISDKEGNYINYIKNKPCLVNSFLQGKKADLVTINHCQQLGKQLAKMHMDAYDFKFSRQNTLGQKHWKKLFENFKYNKNTKYSNLFDDINLELNFLDEKWSRNLPIGIIHGDVFQDNVFFIDDVFSGIIDFYFSCNDYYAYELAICLNAWCFNNDYIIDTNKSAAILNTYQEIRKLSEAEISALPILLRGATMRILLTRLNDQIYHPVNAFVEPKDPIEYFHILKFHQTNNDLKKIGL